MSHSSQTNCSVESPVNFPLCKLESICSFLGRAASRYLVQTVHASGTWHSWQADMSFGKWQYPCQVEKAVGYRHSRVESEGFHCRENMLMARCSLLYFSASRLDHALRVQHLLLVLTIWVFLSCSEFANHPLPNYPGTEPIYSAHLPGSRALIVIEATCFPSEMLT